jgi:hypothetical protein
VPSPFPGMNPYLEQRDTGEDFHHNFITFAQAALSSAVGPRYLVKVEVRPYVRELSAEERRSVGRADAGVTAPPGERSPITPGPNPVAAPVRLVLPTVDVERHSWLEIRDRRNRRVVTVIELLCPTNKTPGPDRDDYLRKRTLLPESRSHFVEIDLRRGGERPRPPDIPPCG